MWIRQSTVMGIVGPTPVQLRCRIVSPNAVVSPVTGHAAAVLAYYALGDQDTLIAHGLLGDHVVLQVRAAHLMVSTRGLEVYFRGANPEPIALLGWPPAFPPHQEAETRAALGSLRYRELALVSGQLVRFRGTIEPAIGRGTYREGAGFEFVVAEGTDPPVLSADVVEHA